uniref:dUTP diphosphatase n=1 Tax=Steinernema glaseri TaxID=37863 RepID=A0A1I7ZG72_9BILA
MVSNVCLCKELSQLRAVVLRRLSRCPSPQQASKMAHLANPPKAPSVVAYGQVNPVMIPFVKASKTAADMTKACYFCGVLLRSAEEATIPPKGKVCISTEIMMAIPEGHYGHVATVNTMARKHMVQVGAGVVDSDYRGIVKVILFNHSETEVKIPAEEPIAQILMDEIYPPSAVTWTKLNEDAQLPVIGSASAAGSDLTSAEDCVVPPGGQKLVRTDLSADFPKDCYGRIAPRSGLTSKNSIHVGGGVCTSRTEPIQVLLFNHGQDEFRIAKGDRIAQFIAQKVVFSAMKPGEPKNLPRSKLAQIWAPPPPAAEIDQFAKIRTPLSFTVGPKDKTTITIDIQQGIPRGCYMRIAPLFSLAVNNSIDIGGGSHYSNGATKITIFNHGTTKKTFEMYEPIAQVIFEKAAAPKFEPRETLDETERGAGGFGSTGIRRG